MLFSIIVPIYNVDRYLKKCIESVIAQDYSDFEVILIDDFSTDKSLEIARSYEQFPKVRLITKEYNSGLSDTRNIGLTEAKGDYVLFLDSDDYIEEGCLSIISKLISINNKPDILYFGYFEEYENVAQEMKKFGYVSKPNLLYTSKEFLMSELKQRNLYAAACFGIYRRDLIINNKLYFKKGIFHEDELWTPQIVFNANTIFASDYSYYHYLRRTNSITKKEDKTKNALDIIQICYELDHIFKNVDTRILKKYIDNHIAKIYMKGISEGKLDGKKYRKYVNRFYPLKKAFFLKDRLKALVFAINLKLYYYLNDLGL
ncbi:glycosyltransferases involved in cell wall biogenesis [Amedibacillus dolichus CAG:375]|uniref:Glycosyltransferases involved in cell wall biogenesis n=1 Tax=Amedibacillus dolichus CAG:375 TaxID=1263076 RepID=R7GA50_9FIRM|nr:glycosyltransferase [Amedibacillus dolichus]CDE23876.1 glycosyltransferases involved in cell wall biogenesis [Amedibacillus dolichus CAG:375]